MEKFVRCKNLPKNTNPIVRKDECPLIHEKIKENDNCQECPFSSSFIKHSKAKAIRPKSSSGSLKASKARKDTAGERWAITTEEAIDRLSKEALIPEENIRIYLHLDVGQGEKDVHPIITGVSLIRGGPTHPPFFVAILVYEPIQNRRS